MQAVLVGRGKILTVKSEKESKIKSSLCHIDAKTYDQAISMLERLYVHGYTTETAYMSIHVYISFL